jgi:CheY-like chemotaxis protein
MNSNILEFIELEKIEKMEKMEAPMTIKSLELVPAPAPSSKKQTIKILVIDDEQEIFDNIKYILERYAEEKGVIELKMVYAAEGTLGLVKMTNEMFDLAIIDNQMPKLDGIKLVEIIKKSKNINKVPIIFISGIFQKNHVEDVADLGVRLLLTKPFDEAKLLKTVQTALSNTKF